MQINRFKIEFNYENIDNDFHIYQISQVEYKEYAKFFNKIKNEIKEALSIIYVDYKVYILTQKKIDVTKTELFVKRQSIKNLGEYQEFIIFKLLVYATSSIKDENVVFDADGIFYIVKPSKRVYQTVLVNIKKDNMGEIFFQLNAKNFIKKTINSNLVRVKNRDNPKTYFVKQKNIDGYKRSSVEYLRTDWTKKYQTKFYVLIRFFRDINKNLKQYISVELDELFFENFKLERTQKKRIEEIDTLIREKFSTEKYGLVIEDFVQDNRSQKFIDEVRVIIESKYGSIVTLGELKSSKSSFNLLITESIGKENDPYSNIKLLSKPSQNILLKNLENTEVILPMLLKELVIKQDIFNKKLSIPNYRESKRISFYLFEKNKEKKDKYLIYKMIMENGNIELSEVVYSQSLFEKDEKSYIEKMLFLASQNNIEPELIIENENGDINFIYKTNYFAIPNIKYIEHEYNLLEEPCYKSYNDLSELDDVPNDRRNEYIEFLESIKEKNKVNLKIEVKNRKVKKYLAKKFNINLDKNLNRSRKNNTELDVLTGIKYSKIDEKNAYYVVGTKEIGASFSRTNIIRKIEAIEGELLLDDLLVMMDEYFIKNKDLTVLPYPLKYLREFVKIKKYK